MSEVIQSSAWTEKRNKPKGKANALAPHPCHIFIMLDQTIPLRVSAETKAALVALAKAESRSLNNWLNLHLESLVQSLKTPHKAIVKSKPKAKAKK